MKEPKDNLVHAIPNNKMVRHTKHRVHNEKQSMIHSTTEPYQTCTSK